MSFDPVPWFVGGGAEHSPDVARMLAFNAANGNEGVLGLQDLSVGALPVPGSSVQVLPGACNILNRTSGYASQMYMGRLPEADTVAVAATGSTGGRSDLVVARIEDPTLAGSPWSPPADVTAGPYIFLRVIAGVPNTTTTVTELGLGYSAIPLARIDIPANTATITQAMITDLRFVANPKTQRMVRTFALQSGDPGIPDKQDTTATTGEFWPDGGGWDLPIPPWAVRARIVATWAQVNAQNLNAIGSLWVGIGPTDQSNPNQVTTQRTRYNTTTGTGVSRWTYVNADTVNIPASMRGTTQLVALRAQKESGADALIIDDLSAVILDIDFDSSRTDDRH